MLYLYLFFQFLFLNIITIKKYSLNKYATIEQREKEFKFYYKIFI
jgi:hypothetical protein